MKVTAVFHGILSDWVGTEKLDFELAEGSRLADLIGEIGRAFRRNMPDQLWDDARNAFVKPVLAVGENGVFRSAAESLSDGQEIKFLLLIAGG